ncbi:uncharacterized protein ACO6RY_14841 [Pungitius sinensis]
MEEKSRRRRRRRRRKEEEEEEEALRWLELHAFRAETTAGGEDDENASGAEGPALHTHRESLITARPSPTRKYVED